MASLISLSLFSDFLDKMPLVLKNQIFGYLSTSDRGRIICVSKKNKENIDRLTLHEHREIADHLNLLSTNLESSPFFEQRDIIKGLSNIVIMHKAWCLYDRKKLISKIIVSLLHLNKLDSLGKPRYHLIKHYQLALEAVKHNGLGIEFIPKHHPDYETLALEAVKQNGLAIRFIPENHPNYKAFALEAVKQNGRAIEFIPKDHPKYRFLAQEAIKEKAKRPRTEPPKMVIIKKDIIESMPQDHPNYAKVAQEAVERNALTIRHIPKDYPNYAKLALAAVEQNGLALQYISNKHRDYAVLALKAVKQNTLAIQSITRRHPVYKDCIIEVFKRDGRVLGIFSIEDFKTIKSYLESRP